MVYLDKKIPYYDERLPSSIYYSTRNMQQEIDPLPHSKPVMRGFNDIAPLCAYGDCRSRSMIGPSDLQELRAHLGWLESLAHTLSYYLLRFARLLASPFDNCVLS